MSKELLTYVRNGIRKLVLPLDSNYFIISIIHKNTSGLTLSKI